MKIVNYTADEAKGLKGDSDLERLKNMTEEEIEQAAREDADNPFLTDEQLKEFRSTVTRGDGVYAHDKDNKQAASKKSQG